MRCCPTNPLSSLFLIIFSFCCSLWVSSIALTSSLLICPSASSNLQSNLSGILFSHYNLFDIFFYFLSLCNRSHCLSTLLLSSVSIFMISLLTIYQVDCLFPFHLVFFPKVFVLLFLLEHIPWAPNFCLIFCL